MSATMNDPNNNDPKQGALAPTAGPWSGGIGNAEGVLSRRKRAP